MSSFLELAQQRRSIRHYLPEPVAEEDLHAILEAGRVAPSGNNLQPWRFIVIRDLEQRKRLAAISGNQQWMIEAPIVIAVIADPTVKLARMKRESIDAQAHLTALIKSVRDAAIAAEHMVLAAEDLGYGTCWVAMYEQEQMRPALQVPEPCYVVTLITIGKPAESPAPRPRLELSEICFEEVYGRRTKS